MGDSTPSLYYGIPLLQDPSQEGSLSGQSESEGVRLLLQGDYEAVLKQEFAQRLFGIKSIKDGTQEAYQDWITAISARLDSTLGNEIQRTKATSDPNVLGQEKKNALVLGLAALNTFMQCNVTGPPLTFRSEDVLFVPDVLKKTGLSVVEVRRSILSSLSVDGETPYPLTPNPELFWLSKTIINHPSLVIAETGVARIHVNFLHQRMLTEAAASLQKQILDDLKTLDASAFGDWDQDSRVRYLLERAAINTYYGFDVKARKDLDLATEETGLQYALTGLLGKRTKFQQNDISQLVVLAKSANGPSNKGKKVKKESDATIRPQNIDLNDDTLLESISFTEQRLISNPAIQDEGSLPSSLTSLDPSSQPRLEPLDSIILLSLASSITNTSPANGLTREETLPYATRVLEGGSSNWQIYTQALLVRSRIEGYKSRTVERGVLQLQALVDQVIAETTGQGEVTGDSTAQSSSATFLPKPKPSESAPVTERLEYVHQLASPTRWELESELAQRWVSLGGLRTALEIYERLQMWAEVALCWAAVDREDKARKIIRKQLFHSKAAKSADTAVDDDEEDTWEGTERSPALADAPRLYSILGDLDNDPLMYIRAWDVSNHRYARAQRSLGKFYFSRNEYMKAAAAYEASLKINQLNHPTWFALGCIRLELQQWSAAIEAFARTVQLDDTDAEAWSNLAAALLHMEAKAPSPSSDTVRADDEEQSSTSSKPSDYDPKRPKRDALKALKRASSLSHDSYRIWSNVLVVAASLSPPSYSDMVQAQSRIIELRGKTEGESCVDEDILDMLLRHTILLSQTDDPDAEPFDPTDLKPGLQRMTAELLEKKVVPLITGSRRLWQIVAKLYLWLRRPSSALAAHEKAWRATLAKPGWEGAGGDDKMWSDVVDATIDLVDAYESLGPMERTEGLAAGSGELVAKDWNFKARSAVRGVMGKGKEMWEDNEGWERLKSSLDGLKA